MKLYYNINLPCAIFYCNFVFSHPDFIILQMLGDDNHLFANSNQRLEVRLQNPNAIFESWLQRWLSEAEAKGNKTQHKLREALNALKRYPLPLASGRDCAILRGFGTKLCNLIDKEMKYQKSKSHIINLNNSLYDKDVYQIVSSIRTKETNTSNKSKKAQPITLTKKQLKVLCEERERFKQVKMCPGNFKILLLVDTQETNGKNKNSLGHTRGYLESLCVEYEVRRLTVGDFLWVAQDPEGNELVLPYIVERKRMDDLARSIRDGRLHEQKHRLKQSGLQHLIYLIEDYAENQHLGLPLENLNQALMNALIHNNFSVEHTENHRRSMIYLYNFGLMLTGLYKNKVLLSCEKQNLKLINPSQHMVGLLKFKDFYNASARNYQLSLREVFVQQLLQLHSLSLEKALAIVSLYPTPRYLLDSYNECRTVNEAGMMLANIKCGKGMRTLGTKISQALYNFYKINF